MKYRFDARLGGGEHEEHHRVSGGTEAPVGTVAFLLDGCLVCVARALLTKVRDPLDEPPIGSFVLVDATVLQRKDTAGIDWWDYGQQTWRTWKQVCDFGTPVRLVPDPFAEPVELPHIVESVLVGLTVPNGTHVFLGLSTDGLANGFQEYQHLTSEQARGVSRALWAAADAAEATS